MSPNELGFYTLGINTLYIKSKAMLVSSLYIYLLVHFKLEIKEIIILKKTVFILFKYFA